jgi:2-polyprenyl-3-methyl-5-hydroxy-6-metoxy-1,4-benzoquinol methylase
VSANYSTSSELPGLRAARLASWGRVNPDRLQAVLCHAGPVVLDVGCSTGGYVEALAARGYQVYGMDLLADRHWKQGVRQGFVAGDSLALAFCDHAFDTVIAFEVIENVSDPCLALAQFHRVCRQSSLRIPPRLAYPAARVLRRFPFRTQYPMTLLAVAEKV